MNDIIKAHEPWCETRLVCDSCHLCPHSDTAKCDCGVETIPPMQTNSPTPNSHDELLPCPFCGSAPKWKECHAPTSASDRSGNISCECGVLMAWAVDYEVASTRWNARADSPEKRLAIAAQNTHPAPLIGEVEREALLRVADNLVMLINRIAYRHKKGLPLDEVIVGAVDYIKRTDEKGLSCLREAARTSPASDIMQGAREAAAYAGTRIHCPSGHTYKTPEALCPHCTSPGPSIGEGEIVEQVELTLCIEEVPHIKGYGFEDYRRVYPELAYRAHSHAKAITRALIATGCIRLKEGA